MDYQAIYDEAKRIGLEAGNAAKPTPMTVQSLENPFDKNSKVLYQETVADGVCGYAWVKIKPARGGFVAWLKSKNIGYTDSYAGGYIFSIREHDQSMQRKEAHASAAAAYLSKTLGIKAFMTSRID